MRPLTLAHPREYITSLPRFRRDPSAPSGWVYAPPPTGAKACAAAYRRDLLGRLDAHALRILNLDWWPDDDARDQLRGSLERAALAAAQHVGVSVAPGRSTSVNIMEGGLSLEWLRDLCATAADFALEHWDPNTGQALRRQHAAAGGRASKRPPTFTPDMLDALPPDASIRAQAEALNCSRRTIANLRRKRKEAAG